MTPAIREKRWTTARRQALAVLYFNDSHARFSNETSLAKAYVYWQSANWLASQGLATIHGEEVVLTALGLEVAGELV